MRVKITVAVANIVIYLNACAAKWIKKKQTFSTFTLSGIISLQFQVYLA